ncbi:MAG: MBL fold metallo-hydrolase [Acidobacteriota bacterium]|nr:MBL fold metallo-hydrolase [Acidobacteriota bacterium]
MAFTRREFVATAAAAAAAASLGRIPLFAQQPAPTFTTAYTEIRRGVGTWTARGGTIGWLVNPEGAIAVDSQFADVASMCVERLLKESGKTRITALINTHHHGDHTGGNGVFRPVTGQIIGHENVPKYMRSSYDAALKRRAETPPAPATPAPAAPVVPDRTFAKAWSFAHGSERITATHYGPAHTGGDAVILFERANVAHMGDLMFNRAHPVIDLVNGGSIKGWIDVLETVASAHAADTIFIFGHAGTGHPITGSRDNLRYHATYLGALLEHVRAEVRAGKSKEEITASTALLRGFEDYGPLIPRPLGPAYDEVTAGGAR